MSKKKSSYKKKFKGVRYIAKALVKYQKGKYSNYNKALPDARKFLSDLKSNEEKVNLKNLWKYSRTRRGTSKKSTSSPDIDSKLKQLSFYFDLMDYPTWILRTTNKVYFTSDLIPDNLPPIQGGSSIDYSVYFAPYVNFINSMKSLTDPNDNRYETDWLVTCTEPFFNKSNKRWESKIISVDTNGNEFNYGFNPSTPSLLATKTKLSEPKEEPKKETEPKEEPKPKSTEKPTEPKETVSQSNVERVKEIRGLISDYRQDVKDGLLSKEDYRELVKELNSKLDRGGSV